VKLACLRHCAAGRLPLKLDHVVDTLPVERRHRAYRWKLPDWKDVMRQTRHTEGAAQLAQITRSLLYAQ
jgi:hypothetical protein